MLSLAPILLSSSLKSESIRRTFYCNAISWFYSAKMEQSLDCLLWNLPMQWNSTTATIGSYQPLEIRQSHREPGSIEVAAGRRLACTWPVGLTEAGQRQARRRVAVMRPLNVHDKNCHDRMAPSRIYDSLPKHPLSSTMFFKILLFE